MQYVLYFDWPSIIVYSIIMFDTPALSLRFPSNQHPQTKNLEVDAQAHPLYSIIESAINKIRLFVINKCKATKIERNSLSEKELKSALGDILHDLDILYKPDVLVRSIKKQEGLIFTCLQPLNIDISHERQSPYCRTILQNLDFFSATLRSLYFQLTEKLDQESFQLFNLPNRIVQNFDEKQILIAHQDTSEKIKALIKQIQIIILKKDEQRILDSLFSYNIFTFEDNTLQNRVKEWVSYGQLNDYTETKKKDGLRWVSKNTILEKQNDFIKDDMAQNKDRQYENRQKIVIDKEFSPKVFRWIFPESHQYFLSSASSIFHQISPFLIKSITFAGKNCQEPKFQIKNYFKEGIDSQKSIIYYCKPSTKSLFYYNLLEIADQMTISKECLYEFKLKISWNFGIFVKTTITPDGNIFAINCRTTSQKLDPSLYEITNFKVKNRGPIPHPLKSSSLIHCDRFVYIIGGTQQNNFCSKRTLKYSIKERKWIQLSDANIGTRNPTLCTFRERFIFKIGGLNEFNYINKVIEIFDTLNNQWAIVNLNAKSLMDEINILQNCCAAQINSNQIYVFGGKNINNYSSDTGLIIEVRSIKEKIKAPPKVDAEVWSTNQAKRSIISFFGVFSSSNIISYNNSLFLLRTKCCQNL